MKWIDRLKGQQEVVSVLSVPLRPSFSSFLPNDDENAAINTKIYPRRELTKLTQPSLAESPKYSLKPSGITLRRKHRKPSGVALGWLKEHRSALLDGGWTLPELYSRKKSNPGILWLDLWDNPFLLAYLHECGGIIEFECSLDGRDFFQTARPKNTPIK